MFLIFMYFYIIDKQLIKFHKFIYYNIKNKSLFKNNKNITLI